MFFQLLLACFLLVDAGKTPDDVSTVTCEDDWWHASRHMDELHSYCSSWHGGVQLHCFDLFSRSGRIARTFAKHGFRSRSYDILSLASQDILSEAGFFEALDTAFQLMDYGLFCAAPPCSLFIPISQSVHQRYVWQPMGNTANLKVRMSNAIAMNTACIVTLLRTYKPKIFVMLEQPKGSTMFELPCFEDLVYNLGMSFLLTYFGFFGMSILKPTRFLTNLTTATTLSRKATRKAKAKFLAREARREERRKRAGREAKIYYTTSINSSGKRTFTGGRNLADTAVYPQRFVTCLFQAWLKARMALNVLNA